MDTALPQAQPTDFSLAGKWRTLMLLAAAELLAMAVWFSASAVVPALTIEWNLTGGQQAWLTMSVQIGFVVGALGSAILCLADRIESRILFAATALAAGVFTMLIAFTTNSFWGAMPLRFLTGVALAGVYPVGMKIMATWTKEDRGLGIGLLVGALTLGSAAPHLLRVFGDISNWQLVLYLAGGMALIGALITILFIDEGPYRRPQLAFSWNQIGQILRNRDVMLANGGYLGHMWELYAMWTWLPVFLAASFAQQNIDPRLTSFAAFGVLAMGALGSLLAGLLADRIGRTTITIGSLVISGTIAASIGFLFGGSPTLLVVVALIWGFVIVADSAQFSACVSELCDSPTLGTSLTLQTSLGFLLTLVTIRMIPFVVDMVGWQWAFAVLALGPVAGIAAMVTLRRSEASQRLAGGRG